MDLILLSIIQLFAYLKYYNVYSLAIKIKMKLINVIRLSLSGIPQRFSQGISKIVWGIIDGITENVNGIDK